MSDTKKKEEEIVKDERPRELHKLPVVQEEIILEEINEGARGRNDYGNLKELMLSLEQKGMIQPIAVMKYKTKFEKKYNYFLLAGGRRFRACKELKWDKIPARIYPHSLNAFEIKSIELEENLRRKDMTDAERIKLTKEVHDYWVSLYGVSKQGRGEKGHTLQDTADNLGVSVGKVHEELDMAQWLNDVPELAALGDKKDIKKAINLAKKTVENRERVAEYEKETEGQDIYKVYERSYIVGNFFEGVKKVPNATIDLVDLDIDFPQEEDDSDFHETARMDKEMGKYKSITTEDYPVMMKLALKESYRILKDRGWIIVWFGREFFKEIQEWAHEAGFHSHWYTGKWHRGDGYAYSRNATKYLGRTIDEFFYFRKGTAEMVTPHPEIFEFPPEVETKKPHPYSKPVPLMYSIFDTFIAPGSRIVVPFVGGGNSLIAGFKYKCHCMGWELSAGYKDQYRIRLREEVK